MILNHRLLIQLLLIIYLFNLNIFKAKFEVVSKVLFNDDDDDDDDVVGCCSENSSFVKIFKFWRFYFNENHEQTNHYLVPKYKACSHECELRFKISSETRFGDFSPLLQHFKSL